MYEKSLPLIDLHRHLDGSIRLETILDLGKKYDIHLPADDLVGLKPFVQITEPRPGVMAFIDKYKSMGEVFSLGHWGDVLFDSFVILLYKN